VAVKHSSAYTVYLCKPSPATIEECPELGRYELTPVSIFGVAENEPRYMVQGTSGGMPFSARVTRAELVRITRPLALLQAAALAPAGATYRELAAAYLTTAGLPLTRRSRARCSNALGAALLGLLAPSERYPRNKNWLARTGPRGHYRYTPTPAGLARLAELARELGRA
jgi:hypothetical protein